MMQHGSMMAEGGHMMGGSLMMMFMMLIYLGLVFVFFWLFYRLVIAAEKIAENTEDK